jgi:hypothetical protein
MDFCGFAMGKGFTPSIMFGTREVVCPAVIRFERLLER